ncbi:Tyrosine-protein phosphatase yvh1 [Ceratocystis lukuohia]|uniref:protein-tyrosine-phosphatase n=1 Tax=Ceratocystis lukuohia TaxID=2019550 RepID=A0ABR4MUE6_9PEZI
MDDDPLAKSLKTQRLSFINRLSELQREAQSDPVTRPRAPGVPINGDLPEDPEEDDPSARSGPDFRTRTTTTTTTTTAFPPSPSSSATPHSPSSLSHDFGPELDGEDEFRNKPRERLDRALSFMALNRIPGDAEIYVGGVFALKRPQALKDHGITHILTVLGNMMDGVVPTDVYKHHVIEIDDMDDEDILIHLPKAIRFIDDALNPPHPPSPPTTTAKPLQTQETKPTSLPSSPSPPRAPTPKPEVEESITDRADREAAEMVLGSRPPRTSASAATPAPPTAPVAEPESPPEVEATAKPNAPAPRRNAVYVHCAMGKSRSVTVVCAYLMWKYPEYFGLSAVVALDPARKILRRRRGHDAMLDAIDWVRRGRDIADPNPGFREQLAMWWEMACPEDVESHPIYRKWAFRREVDASVACGMAPTILRFEDEEDAAALARLELAEDEDDLDLDADGNPRATGAAGTSAKPPQQPSLRCKMCRRTLVTTPFIVSTDHQNPFAPEGANPDVPCQHYFIEPLSWMRETLQAGELEGRLLCPNKRCTSAVGRYSWKGFRCSCSEWVTPAFSLQKSRVDEVKELPIGQRMRELGIRRPPRRQNL